MTAMQNAILRIIKAHGKEKEWEQPDFHLKVQNPPYMPLTIEKLYADDHGRVVVSVCHYGEQNGDAMRDPEMCFDAVTWQPLYFRNDYQGVEQYVYDTPKHERYYPRLLKELVSFQATWAKNLLDQGFADRECQLVQQTNSVQEMTA